MQALSHRRAPKKSSEWAGKDTYFANRMRHDGFLCCPQVDVPSWGGKLRNCKADFMLCRLWFVSAVTDTVKRKQPKIINICSCPLRQVALRFDQGPMTAVSNTPDQLQPGYCH